MTDWGDLAELQLRIAKVENFNFRYRRADSFSPSAAVRKIALAIAAKNTTNANAISSSHSSFASQNADANNFTTSLAPNSLASIEVSSSTAPTPAHQPPETIKVNSLSFITGADDSSVQTTDVPEPGRAEPKNLQYCFKKDYRPSADDDDDDEDEEDLSAAEVSLLKKILRTKLLESSAHIEVERKRDDSPLHSCKTFAQLPIPPNLLKGIYAMNYDAPSRIQEISLPTLLANPPANMIAQAQSGTGKTASFLVASIARVDVDLCHPQVLILAPTFELAVQIGDVARKMAAFCPSMSCRYAVRGESVPRGHSLTEHIIIGTPGKVHDWARRIRCFDITRIRVFVLDEADVMISTQGHQDQCIRIHQMLPKDHCQMLLFSATYSQEVMEFAEQIIPDPIVIRLRREEQSLDNIHQYFIRCASPETKYAALCNIYGAISVGQTIIFCRTRRTACWLGQQLTQDGHSVGYLSGELPVQERSDVITSFRKGKEKVLITTNVCARGIDIEQITMVVNFDLPVTMQGDPDYETYLHRIGRTGRFGKSGFAINLVSSDRDEYIRKTIEDYFQKPIKKIDAEDVDDLEALDS